jgi:serine/threonine protein kinase/formylglycine-generating enzyme required for sulfatase activity
MVDPTRSSAPDPAADSAAVVFNAFVHQALRDGETGDIEDLCAGYPRLASRLRHQYEEWLAFSALERFLPANNRQPLAEGLSLGDFRLVGLLGRGGMGEVWESWQDSLGRSVALKFLRTDLTSSERQLSRFHREAAASARLTHDGIVTVYGKGQFESLHFIVQELVPGGKNLFDTLEELRTQGEVSRDHYRWVAQLFLQLAKALELAHEAGVVHRDVKPSNILITPEGTPKVTDFGLAQFIDGEPLSRSGEVSGTFPYMSPEQVLAKRDAIEPRTDVFSLSAVLYETLTGHRAFHGDTPHQIMKKILYEDPPEPDRVRSRVPRDLAVICMKGLEKKRDRRYSTMRSLANDLQLFLDQRPILARPPGHLLRFKKWCSRHPAAAVALFMSVAGLLLASVLLGVTLQTKQELEVAAASLAERNVELEQARSSEQRQRELAEQERRSVLRLSNLKRLRDLQLNAADLWPAYPRQTAALEEWLEAAEKLHDQLPLHEQDLAQLAEARSDTVDHLTGEQRDWWFETLRALVEDLRNFCSEAGLLENVRARLDDSRSIAKRSVEAFADDWEEALNDLALGDRYGGLELDPQMGLVPVGVDPDSGLWEFWHVESGPMPTRDPESGRLQVTGEEGVVLVLIPAGEFWMGAQNSRPLEPNYDPQSSDKEIPPHRIGVEAFFLAKFEFTQAHWQRITGTNPSNFGKNHDDWALHPVDNVSWYECQENLRRVGLCLPTEAQWEFAARAGTSTPWWTGENPESLTDAANLADQAMNRDFRAVVSFEAWLDDGLAIHGPVERFRGNPWGIYGLVGNVREWCSDWFRYYPRRAGDPPPKLNETGEHKVMRGGDFFALAEGGRSAMRHARSPAHRDNNIGVRAARQLDLPR